MELTRSERTTLAMLGLIALGGCAVLLWQRRPVSLAIAGLPVPAAQGAQWDRRLAAARQVDVNTADAAELERLPGIGPRLARRIVAEREAHGRFRTPEELSRVAGIGPATVERLADYVVAEF